MKTILTTLLIVVSNINFAQQIDTLAIQDFETVPMAPVWNYSGTLSNVQVGYASATSCIPSTPLGINGSQAWHVVSVSGGNQITFNNTTIPTGYDTVRVHFNLAALNLNGSTGGPDNLDYVLVEYSLNNGTTFVSRLRIRGAINNDSFWAYDATGFAAVQHLPATEALFQPTSSGLQVAQGYSNCEISFPGSISQLTIRITPRSSSSSDSWLIDNLVLTGETNCVPSTNVIAETTCDTYTAPSGAVYTTSGNYSDTIANSTGCDSIISINLTVNNSMTANDTQTSCDSYTWVDGVTYTASNNTATYIFTTAEGCDSLVTLNLTINTTPDNSVTQTGSSLSANQTGANYQWLDCSNGFSAINGGTNQAFTPPFSGSYAVLVSSNGCSDTSTCFIVDYTGIEELTKDERVLVQIVDFMGRETEMKLNTSLIFIYSDGTRERVLKIAE